MIRDIVSTKFHVNIKTERICRVERNKNVTTVAFPAENVIHSIDLLWELRGTHAFLTSHLVNYIQKKITFSLMQTNVSVNVTRNMNCLKHKYSLNAVTYTELANGTRIH